MKYAVIDLGSNTIRLCMYEERGNNLSLFLNTRVMARLGSKIKDGALTEEGINQAVEALTSLQYTAILQGADHIFVFATASLRNITNSKDALCAISQKSGLSIDLLSGEEEASLNFEGVMAKTPFLSGLIADVGGGSSEVITVTDGKMTEETSFPIGSLTSFVRFAGKRPITENHIQNLRAYIRSLLTEKFPNPTPLDVFYGIGGAPRVCYELKQVLAPEQEATFTVLEDILHTLAKDSTLAEKTIAKASPERQDTALCGMAIVCEIGNYFACRQLAICDAGLREGYLRKKIGETERL